jgi:hypothetical protein
MEFIVELLSTGNPNVDVPADVAADLANVYEALSKLPVNRMASTDFLDLSKAHPKEVIDTATEAAKTFMKQAKTWCANHLDAEGNPAPLTFSRRGDIKGIPTRVSFRIYAPRPATPEETPADTPAG